MEPTLVGLALVVLVLAAFCFAVYMIVKAAVAQGIKETLWSLEASMRSAVKAGVLEAIVELEKNPSETEKNHG